MKVCKRSQFPKLFHKEKQARKSSEDTQGAGLKKFRLGKLWVEQVWAQNNLGSLSSTFHVEQPETLIEWKFESIMDRRTNGFTD